VRPGVVRVGDELIETVDHGRVRTRIRLAPGRTELPGTRARLTDSLGARGGGLVEGEDLPELAALRVLIDLSSDAISVANDACSFASSGNGCLLDRSMEAEIRTVGTVIVADRREASILGGHGRAISHAGVCPPTPCDTTRSPPHSTPAAAWVGPGLKGPLGDGRTRV
jgi:hypothetical protein